MIPDPVQEREEMFIELGAVFKIAHVGCMGDDVKLRSGDCLVDGPGGRGGREGVMLPDENEGGNGDLPE